MRRGGREGHRSIGEHGLLTRQHIRRTRLLEPQKIDVSGAELASNFMAIASYELDR